MQERNCKRGQRQLAINARAAVVSRWPKGSSSVRANKLGLFAEKTFDDIIRQYIADTQASPNAAQALKGYTP